MAYYSNLNKNEMSRGGEALTAIVVKFGGGARGMGCGLLVIDGKRSFPFLSARAS